MATKKSTKRNRKPARKPRKAARKAPKAARKRATSKRAAPKKASAKKKASPPARKVRQGFISHTELASSDPAATKQWCQQVLGWKFGTPMPTPGGDYHMWSFGDTGGGIRANNPPETPGSIPYCEVTNIQATFDKALSAGAMPMMAPEEIPGSGGSIAIVRVPGGVAIGFWGPKK